MPEFVPEFVPVLDRVFGKGDTAGRTMFALEGEGHGLTDRLPDLLLETVRVSTTVTHGVHGRRRAGSGETFWQFRQFETGDAAQQIDWRRSAATDHLFVREREWEAAHTIWLWSDISTSMSFKSHLSNVVKRDRALVMMFASAEMLVRSGERVALMGLTQPSASRKVTTRLAEMLAANAKSPLIATSQPPPQRVSRFASTLWFSDFLDPIEKIAPRIEELAHQDVIGHLVQVLDPAEETLPYDGRTEFIGIEDNQRWLADRAESLRSIYREKLLAHRDAISSLCRRLGWSFAVHHTDRPPAETMLHLIMRLRGEPMPSAKPAAGEFGDEDHAMSIGSLAFLNPALLAGLLALPLIYWLLRTVPPAPRRVEFPATRILVGIENKEKQPSKTPWWLTLIRLLAAALVIFALAEPVLNPNRQTAVSGNGPVAIVIDNSWAASSNWSERTRMIDRLITEAETQGRPVVIAPTALTAKSPVFRIEAAAQARSSAAAILPQPFAPDRLLAAKALETALASAASGNSLVWITDGIDHDGTTQAFTERAAAIARGGSAIVIDIPNGQEALGLAASLGQGGRLEAEVIRAAGTARQGAVHAFSVRGQRLGEGRFNFAVNDTRAALRFDMPLELRNQVTRVEIAGERSAGGVHLLDARAQWHRIGILSGASREQAQPLLAPLYYVERALAPFAELAKSEDANIAAAVEDLMKRNISILLLADIGTLSGALKDRVDNWVKKGGVLVRFSGPRLEKGGDDLLPAPLRAGGRALGGALSWSTPQPLAAFTDDSLFAGLAIPADVLVNRQVLAEPGRIGPDVKSWARLKDGTPLVTAIKRGEGQIVLFHVTANSEWSSLPISGLFVEMLRRIATLGKAGGVSGEATVADTKDTATTAQTENAEVLPPLQVLDGFGLLKAPPPTAESIAAAKINDAKPSAENPPGYYGPQASPRALNLITTKTVLKPLPALPSAFERRAYETGTAKPLKPTLLGFALALLFADILAVLALTGGLAALTRIFATRAAALFLAATLASTLAHAPIAHAQGNPGGPIRPFSPNDLNRQPGTFFGSPLSTGPAAPQRAPATGPDAGTINATSKVTIGYVLSGDAATDQTSRQGLTGLVRYLTAKTAVEPGEPSAVNIVNDEIAFFPILYWPVLPTARPLNDRTLAKIDAYMKQGGMIIFDTRDAGTALPAGFGIQQQGGGNPLQRLLGTLDIPRLEPVPETHVLTKSFYLLRQFPGRFDNGQLWVEAEAPADSNQGRQARRVDGVSSILVTSNDFASAWALDERSRPLYPAVPGGETQREIAFRVGVNIVMYALTGNYKADQVHIPALLERLGQ